MAFVTKTWANRVSTNPNKRKLTVVSDSGSHLSADDQIVVTVTRDEGTISAEGDAFSAANMNDLETRINTETTAIRTAMGTQVTYSLSGTTLSITTK